MIQLQAPIATRTIGVDDDYLKREVYSMSSGTDPINCQKILRTSDKGAPAQYLVSCCTTLTPMLTGWCPCRPQAAYIHKFHRGSTSCHIETLLQLPEHISSMDVVYQDNIMYFCGTVLEALRLKSTSEYSSCMYCTIIRPYLSPAMHCVP
jgi:hypothetical protein